MFGSAVRVGFWMDMPLCLIGSVLNSLSWGMWPSGGWKILEMKVYLMASSIGSYMGLIWRDVHVMRWRKWHSFWSDCFIPDSSVWGKYVATVYSFITLSDHYSFFDVINIFRWVTNISSEISVAWNYFKAEPFELFCYYCDWVGVYCYDWFEWFRVVTSGWSVGSKDEKLVMALVPMHSGDTIICTPFFFQLWQGELQVFYEWH